MEKKFCKGKCVAKRFPYLSYHCDNKEWKDGYCKIHHPEVKAVKRNVILYKKEALWQVAKEKNKLEEAKYNALLEVAKGMGEALNYCKGFSTINEIDRVDALRAWREFKEEK